MPRKCSLHFHHSNIIITHFSDTLPRVKLLFFKTLSNWVSFNSQLLRLHSSVVTRWATPVRDLISSVLELCCIKGDSRSSGGNRLLCRVLWRLYTFNTSLLGFFLSPGWRSCHGRAKKDYFCRTSSQLQSLQIRGWNFSLHVFETKLKTEQGKARESQSSKVMTTLNPFVNA